MAVPKNIAKLQVRVWDLPTRIYHWGQLILVAAALLLGFFGPEWWLDAHVYVGYAIIAFIVFRLIWGVWGPEYSRFSNFLFSPKAVISHIKKLVSGRPSHFLGHNPLGSLMVFALILILALLSISGLTVLGGVENQGPLAGFASFSLGTLARIGHEFLAYLLVGMIVAHIFGVLFESYMSKTSLTRAMVDGRKPVTEDQRPATLYPVRKKGGMIIAFGVICVIGAVGALASTMPASGLIAMPVNESFQSECADCHQVYHPSLLPRESWVSLMENLSDHFGEDASLGADTTNEIMSYLSRYAAQAWDTEAANFLSLVDEKHPFQITATPFWISRHANIPQEIFRTKPVNSKANCSACHKDAAGGMFADQNIQIAHGQN